MANSKAPVAPTISSRTLTLDVLRGVAILGILLANVGVFAMPFEKHMRGIYLPIETSTTLNNALFALVVGKFRSMLAILFGVGIWLQYRKRHQDRDQWPGGYLKRTFWLAVFGLVHALAIWYGDILLQYAVIAFVATFLVHLPQKTLLQIIAVLVAITLFCGSTLGLIMANLPADALPAQNASVYATGSYLDQLQDRLNMFAMGLLNASYMVPFMLPLFLLGILLGQTEALAHPSKRPKIRNLCLGLGLGLGLPLNFLAFVIDDLSYGIFWEVLFGPLLGVGYTMLGAVLVEMGVLGFLQAALARVGRIALTTYIMQSLIMTAIFYSWGGGLFGQLDALPLLGVVAAVWLFNVIFAVLWLQVFAMGPLEWLWRSLTESKVLPIRRKELLALEGSHTAFPS